MNRRSLLLGLGASVLASPAIVRVGSIMPVRRVFDIEVDPVTNGPILPVKWQKMVRMVVLHYDWDDDRATLKNFRWVRA